MTDLATAVVPEGAPDGGNRLTMDGIYKSFFGVPVLKDVSLAVAPGSVVGLIGENGAGKSTMMNILGGVLAPDSGTMTLDGATYAPPNPKAAEAHGVVFVHQELNLFDNLSIADNLFLTKPPRFILPPFISRGRAVADSRVLLERVGLERDPRLTVDRLSPGERQQVEIAKALGRNPRVLILDEPTTSLTARESRRLFEVVRDLAGQGVAVIYISHILEHVRDLSDHLVVLRDGSVVTSGATADFPIDQMVQNMVGRQLGQMYPDRSAQATDEVLLDVRGVAEPGIVHDINVHVCRGEVVGLFGLMGAGRTELARMLFGLDRYSAGEIAVGGTVVTRLTPRTAIRAGLALVSEDRRKEGLFMESTVADNVAMAALPRHTVGPGVVNDRQMGKLSEEAWTTVGLRAARPKRQAVKSLSGGNQQKAVLAKWLLTDPQVLILDEPTRGIDVGAKAEIYRLIDSLASGGAGILMISSELDELLGTCDRIVVMRRGEVVREFARESFDETRILAAAFGQAESASGSGAGEAVGDGAGESEAGR